MTVVYLASHKWDGYIDALTRKWHSDHLRARDGDRAEELKKIQKNWVLVGFQHEVFSARDDYFKFLLMMRHDDYNVAALISTHQEIPGGYMGLDLVIKNFQKETINWVATELSHCFRHRYPNRFRPHMRVFPQEGIRVYSKYQRAAHPTGQLHR